MNLNKASNNVQVVIRVRPLTNSYATGDLSLVSLDQSLLKEQQQRKCLKDISSTTLHTESATSESYTFDYIAGE